MAKFRTRFSRKSKYYISKHAFLTAFYFSLNYIDWKQEHDLGIGLTRGSSGESGGGGIGDPTATQAIRFADLAGKIGMIEQAAYDADPVIHEWILLYVTREDMTFDKLKALDMPCEKDMFYDRRRKYYWLLSKKLGL